MDVGVYFDLRNPPGWRQDWSRLYGFTLEAAEEAERLGADSVWLSEHHLFEDGYLNQPLTFAAAVAARTRTVRIGTAVLVAPFWNPVQLAEEASVVDLVSGGRLDLGLGAGYRVPEFELFGADLGKRYTATTEAVRRVREIWDDPAHLPSPVQQPPPIWLGFMGPKGARRAGRLGEGLLTVNRALHQPYLDGLAEGGHGADRARMTGPLFTYVSEDPERDWAVVREHYAYQANSYRNALVEGTDLPPAKQADPDRHRARGTTATLGGIGCGTPEQVAAEARDLLTGLPVTGVFIFASVAGMPERMVMDHIATICGRLRPLLQDL